jgi:hypothetical protein
VRQGYPREYRYSTFASDSGKIGEYVGKTPILAEGHQLLIII